MLCLITKIDDRKIKTLLSLRMFINVLDTAEIQKCSEDVRSIKVVYLYICINVCIVCVYEYRKKKKSDVYTSTHLRNGNLVKKHNAIQVLNKLLHN